MKTAAINSAKPETPRTTMVRGLIAVPLKPACTFPQPAGNAGQFHVLSCALRPRFTAASEPGDPPLMLDDNPVKSNGTLDAGPRPRRSVSGPPVSGRLAASVRQLRAVDGRAAQDHLRDLAGV